jgi:chromosomal replication initiation ATPase DnaA
MTVYDILRDVARKHRLKIDDMKSRRRVRYLVEARIDFIRRVGTERQLSDGQIGRLINRTAWTVRHHRNEAAGARKKAMSLAWHRRTKPKEDAHAQQSQ